MKIALGTVQLGIPYGINNETGVPSPDEIKTIFSIAQEEGIKILDTAPGYGDAEKKIGSLAETRFHIVSKFSNAKGKQDLLEQLNTSLIHLQSESVYGYMAHNADNLIAEPALWDVLVNEKDNKRIGKIGYSLYTTGQLEKLLSLDLVPDIVQIPYNLLDRNFEPYLEQLKASGVEIHTRSVFLQGLFFKSPDSFPVYLEPLMKYVTELQAIANESAFSMSELAMGYLVSNEHVDHVVIGVDNAAQLKENIHYALTALPAQVTERIRAITVKETALLYPYNWK